MAVLFKSKSDKKQVIIPKNKKFLRYLLVSFKMLYLIYIIKRKEALFVRKIIALVLILGLCLCSCAAPQEPKLIPERGTVTARTYENEVFGIGYTATAGMVYYSDSEIAAAMGISESSVLTDPEELAEAYAIYDMFCVDSATGESINISFEHTSVPMNEYLHEITYHIGEDLLEAGLGFRSAEMKFDPLAGEDVYRLNILIDADGVELYETVVAKNVEDWLIVITATSFTEEDCRSILEGIYFI